MTTPFFHSSIYHFNFILYPFEQTSTNNLGYLKGVSALVLFTFPGQRLSYKQARKLNVFIRGIFESSEFSTSSCQVRFGKIEKSNLMLSTCKLF